MGLYKLFSYNVEVQYKSFFLSKAMFFTLLTTVLTIILPFLLAYRSRGFWLRSHYFYEQPVVHFTYEYIIIAETEDPSQPIVCSDTSMLDDDNYGSENCAELMVKEYDFNKDGKNDVLDFKLHLNVPPNRSIVSMIVILSLDVQFKTVCPLQMQSLSVIDKQFPIPPSGLKFYGDLELQQHTHLPCHRDHLDTTYNNSLLQSAVQTYENIVDAIFSQYFYREVVTQVKKMYSRHQNGHTGNMNMDIKLRIPEMQVRYKPSFMQELKWAWPQYLSLMVIFHWIFGKLKRFVFNNRLLMAWEIVPWKKI